MKPRASVSDFIKQPDSDPLEMAWLDAVSPDIAEDAQTIADALVHDAPGQSGEAHWNEEAKALIAGIILHTVVHEPPALATLATVRDKLTRDPAGFAALLAVMQASTGAHGLIARAANRHLGKSDREARGRVVVRPASYPFPRQHVGV